ncbi:hypothetical protein [Roseivirga pacifica]|uniref:hypothetical protein n=1 Tax=Roseivirga pacifica TaxID=1267423 RepID=UPI002095EC5F|nr:hypothetical protein [Roseivirga pacifica]MCO6358943.1 hypothetical protein [Roseivirga pacifica]MCO6365421.1 hypothetical protein [Roseivirga pacifica]MCO6371849.1 hypothetical protein [Roseivirga pacifica]MCO6376040.1 hypothetical protein [Roseivirga pacifica]MCO6379227.1 hypothetical protein [Roseivirga pacifica]
MSINTRVAWLIQDFGDSENAFAKRLEVSSSVMFNIVNPKGRLSYPSGPVLEKLLALEKDGQKISAEWLMRGEGEPYISNSQQAIASPEEALEYLRLTIEELQKNSKSE